MASDLFAAAFIKMIQEEMMSATVFGLGAAGDQGGSVPGGLDFYAPGDARVPKALGVTKRIGKRKVPMQRRDLNSN